MSWIIRIAGYRLKDGRLVRDARRLSVSDRLRQVGSKRVRVVRPTLLVFNRTHSLPPSRRRA
jgi:hypothetical protein